MMPPIVCGECGHEFDYKAAEWAREPYRGAWQAICDWEREHNPAGDPTPLRKALYAIADEQPEGQDAFALRTTRYGRDDTD